MIYRLILLFLVICSGCSSLPADIAERAARTSQSCLQAAERTEQALRALDYCPTLCIGYPFPGSKRHAWVEYDGKVLDPYPFTGIIELSGWEIDAHEYQADVRVTKYRMSPEEMEEAERLIADNY